MIQQSLKSRVSVQWLQIVVGGELAGICKPQIDGLLQLVERLIVATEDSQADGVLIMCVRQRDALALRRVLQICFE